MSKTAKQDPKQAPAPASEAPAVATESAAPGTKSETAAEPATAAEPEETAEAATDSDASDLDETKRKFREALERKHQVHNDAQGKNGREGSKINGAHGPAASHRNFRRKSG
jgi:hypothetical protein